MATTIQLKTPKLPARKAAAVKRRAAELGFTLEEYLKHLIEDDLAISDAARSTSLADLAAPFREALAGISGRELDQRVKAARAARRTGSAPHRR